MTLVAAEGCVGLSTITLLGSTGQHEHRLGNRLGLCRVGRGGIAIGESRHIGEPFSPINLTGIALCSAIGADLLNLRSRDKPSS